MKLSFISVIISSENTLAFYKAIGFAEISREIRPDSHDILVWLERNGLLLKVFIDSTHPSRLTNPEAYGLRHLSFVVEDLAGLHEKLTEFNPDPIKGSKRRRFFFVRDPDGCPFRFEEA